MGAGSSMNAELWFGVLQAAVLIVALVLLYRPVGDYMAHVFSTPRDLKACLLYTSPSPRDVEESRMPSSA